MNVRVVPDIAVPHVTMLTDVGAQPSAANRKTLHLFDVIATDSLGHVHIQITATKPNDDEIWLVLELHDARVAGAVQVGLHTASLKQDVRRSVPLSPVPMTEASNKNAAKRRRMSALDCRGRRDSYSYNLRRLSKLLKTRYAKPAEFSTLGW